MRGIHIFGLIPLIFAAASAQELSEKEMRILMQFDNAPRMIRGGRVAARWFEDGDTFWFEDQEGRHFVDPLAKAVRSLSEEEHSAWKPEEQRQQRDKSFSPSFERYAYSINGDLFVQALGEAEGRNLTGDGEEDVYWQVDVQGWSPDSTKVIGLRIDARGVHHIPIVEYTWPEETVREVPYAKAGGSFMQVEFAVFAFDTGEKTVVDTGTEEAYLFPVGWRQDSSELLFLRLSREAKRLDLMAADPGTGKSRVVLTDTQETFVGGLDFITGGWKEYYTPIEGTDEFLWLSERDGWRHIYRYDLDGRLIGRLTEGPFPVLMVVDVDREQDLVFFKANAEERPYDSHLYRVNLDGEGFKRLTEGTGDHLVQLAPSKRCFLDQHSSVTRPPVTEVRSTEGEHLLTLSEADTTALEAFGWLPGEEFTVKADDGATDLRGILFRPIDFDPQKKYPVIDFIYAGPFTTVVPNTYASPDRLPRHANSMAQLGFITFIVDGRGTTQRGKAFQDASYGRIGEIEIPDHVAALRQLAAERPYMDLDRVGIFGTSWGGYFALRGMLTAPDVFHVGIAVAPGDLTEAQAINEPYMGLPKNNQKGYAAGSNPNVADQLKGKLLLIHGTADVNAPVSTTMRMADALIRSGKMHDMAIIPGANHFFGGSGGMYMSRLVIQYFREHLQGR
jgi:dipeptidyl aminopeptidase/acylaminoacyl peptidase